MSSREQSLAIPMEIREQVAERDGGLCRLCGRRDVICHHIRYGGDEVGMGGRRFHSVENIVSLGQYYEHQCHERVHGNKALWTPLLIAVVDQPGVSAFQVYRWVLRGALTVDLGLDLGAVEAVIRDHAGRAAARERSLAGRPARTRAVLLAERRAARLRGEF